MQENEKVTVKLISHIGWAGKMLPPGRLLDTDKVMARGLIARERAMLATEEEKAQATAAGQVPSTSGQWMESA
jgi:hypothetical protein